MSILESVRRDVEKSQSTTAAGTSAKAERPKTQFWLNVGIVLTGAGKDGEDLFVSLPMGLALDDMKAVNVRGQNADWVHLQQAKNSLLEATKKAGANLQPGERQLLPEFSVELARISENDQQGNAAENPLIGALLNQLGGKRD